ncbi:serine/threonine protein kinase [Cryptosporangium aurantiacum]|uniref:non-specific serine/threonine protein kinase n=2 Tax=Cryptosporangium aurantiacum TaxID=134849 RepID=A0A1M7RBU9_9ACTN|nr:serine/threonine protein kinase [Cryptosporangium aurantiacum]
MGEVWQATDPVLQRTVAVKVLLPSLLSDAEFISRFRTEARLMAALRHPGIVQVHDYGADALVDDVRRDFLVMEYIEGVSLGKHVAAAGALGVAETLSIVAQAAEALDVAHRAGIVHRDVKPNNLLVRPDGTIVLVDFGVARSVDTTSITNPNMIVGSPQYMAPEQVTGEPVTAATDIHALGSVAFCCLTGRSPFAADNAVQVIARLLHGGPPAFPAAVPDAVARLVLRALDPDPARRFPTAAAFAAAARALASAPDTGVALSAPPPADPDATPRLTAAPPHVPAPPSGAPTPQNGLAPHGAPWSGPGVGSPVSGAPVFPMADAAPAAALSARAGRRNRMLAVAGAAALVLGVTTVAGVIVLQPSAERSTATTTAAGRGDADGPDDAGSGAPASTSAGPSASAASPTASGSPAAAPSGSQPAATQPAAAPPTASTGVSEEPVETESPTRRPTTAPATNPYSATQVCGSGYRVVDSAALKKSDGTLVGTVYLLYQASGGRNCVLTLKRTAIGSKTAATAFLQVQGKTRATDSGSFAYYAGPVRAAAAKTCVKWGGSTGGATYASPYEHCG